ncbi:MAG: peptide transporter TolQ [Planctomycetaceae bacterium]|jgi:biopolymer transport protein ExbB/TolQ|nr:peptide transporter TolQ [Planctomycetaceae bacterium]MDP7276965.1 MotA/TolQ/ExbB proton channel family protein [Planctomycetaceae bacterium]
MNTIYDILDVADEAIYGALALAALFGVFTVIMVLRRIRVKRFSRAAHADAFLDEVGDNLRAGNPDGILGLCDSPRYWSKAVPQLITLAMANRDRPTNKVRRLLAERFETDVLADLEYRAGWISTVVKSAPMLGLLGTVIGMINAFQTIAGSGKTGVDPSALADDIGVALFTTALGLTVAIPLVILGAMVHVRIGKLSDGVQQQIGRFVDELDSLRTGGGGN